VHACHDNLVIALYVALDELLGPRQGPGRPPNSATPNWSAWPSRRSCSASAPNTTGCGLPEPGWATCSPMYQAGCEVPPLSRRLPKLVHLDQGGSLRWQHHASTHRS
jgi:hypothetical protein